MIVIISNMHRRVSIHWAVRVHSTKILYSTTNMGKSDWPKYDLKMIWLARIWPWKWITTSTLHQVVLNLDHHIWTPWFSNNTAAGWWRCPLGASVSNVCLWMSEFSFVWLSRIWLDWPEYDLEDELLHQVVIDLDNHHFSIWDPWFSNTTEAAPWRCPMGFMCLCLCCFFLS